MYLYRHLHHSTILPLHHIARYDATGEWYCDADVDTDTQLSESQVEGFITNGAISLANGSTMNGSTLVTNATDANTQLSESEVETFITNGAVDLATGSQVNGSNIVTSASDSDTLAGLNCNTDEIAKYNGSAWVCATESSGSGGGLSYTAMYEVTATSSATPFAQCNDSDDILISGGCNSAQTQIWGTYPEGATDNASASGWKCYAGNVSVTATAICLTQ